MSRFMLEYLIVQADAIRAVLWPMLIITAILTILGWLVIVVFPVETEDHKPDQKEAMKFAREMRNWFAGPMTILTLTCGALLVTIPTTDGARMIRQNLTVTKPYPPSYADDKWLPSHVVERNP